MQGVVTFKRIGIREYFRRFFEADLVLDGIY
jgi:hypothetical protein